MAYFIVIGTNDKVNGVVDEIVKSHQSHNIVSSGCITTKEDRGLTYKWVPLGDGSESKDGDTHLLKDLLTNHLSNFKSVLPSNETPKVMLVSNCMDAEDEERLEWMLDELFVTEGDAFSAPQVDVVLIGYDLTRKNDVTLRPHWRILKKVKGHLDRHHLQVNLLYVNNMDYCGAATYIGDKLLGRFLGHWEMMIDAGCRNIINSGVYSVGLAEYQYNFEDLAEYFELDTERALIERKLNASPSPATQVLLDKKRCFDIDIKQPWLDGLRTIKSIWETYCETKYDFAKATEDNVYCLEKQRKRIVAYLNSFLKIYVDKCRKELSEFEEELSKEEAVVQTLIEQQSEIENQINVSEQEHPEELQKTLDKVTSNVNKQNEIVARLSLKIQHLNREIEDNTFKDVDEIAQQYNPAALVTDDEKDEYNEVLGKYAQLESYVQSDEGAKLIKKVILESLGEKCAAYPKNDLDSIGRLEEIVDAKQLEPKNLSPQEPIDEPVPLPSRKGCAPWTWFMSLWGQSPKGDDKVELADTQDMGSEQTANVISEGTGVEAAKAINALKLKMTSVQEWWNMLLSTISSNQKRMEECSNRIENYGDSIPNHTKSRTLIDINKVNVYRQNDSNYRQNVLDVLDTWYNPALEKRPSLKALIDDKVITQLGRKYSILAWDNTNPFVKENLSDADIHHAVEHVSVQSKPFVQYENIVSDSVKNQIADYFFFNNPNIEREPVPFRNQYSVASGTLCPMYLEEFRNSLCAVQVMEIKNLISDVKDFTPKREFMISTKPEDPDFSNECHRIIGDAQTPRDIARRIYDWLCDNVQYDTTKSIHDADTCWRTKKGVCRAYCDLFCHIAGKRLNVEVVVGKCKMPDGSISDTMHAWLYVYTDGYEGIFIDPTWGAGGINGGRFVQGRSRDTWFDVDPAWMIFTHYPEDDNFKVLDVDVSEKQFKQLPTLYPDADKKALDELCYYLEHL